MNSVTKERRTPLHLACRRENTQIVNILLENGAEVNATDGLGDTPLHIACENSNLTIMQKLLDNKANMHVHNKQGFKPYELGAVANLEEYSSIDAERQSIDSVSKSTAQKVFVHNVNSKKADDMFDNFKRKAYKRDTS